MPACRIVVAAALSLVLSGGAFAQSPREAARNACKADYAAFCSSVRPGGGRIIACFKENEAKLSPGCREVIASAKAKN